MNQILIVDKPKDYTSRDVVNVLSKKFSTTKIGHTGTLDPLATGVLVICLGKALKVAELLTSTTKEYIATIILGFETGTLDVTGNLTVQKPINDLTAQDLKKVLNKFTGLIEQEVPKYSAVKVNGKKLYEYARTNQPVKLPKRTVEIFAIELLSGPIRVEPYLEFKIKCKVSKGTYIRSLVRDIGRELNTYATMKDLIRTKQGNFSLADAYSLEDIKNDNYKLVTIPESLDIPHLQVDANLATKIKNGQILPKFFTEEKVLLIDKANEPLGIYQTYEKDPSKVKPWKIF